MGRPRITAELLMHTDLKDVVADIGNGLSKAAKQHAREVKKTVGSAWRDAVSMALGSNQTEAAMKSFLQSNITDAAEKYQALMAKGRVLEAQAQKELLEHRAKSFKKEVQLRRQAYKEVQDGQLKTAVESADAFKGGAQKVRGMLSGDMFGGAADIGKSAGGFIQKRGRARLGRVEEMRAAGADPKEMAATARSGKALASLGAGLATFAAVAGALLVLIKIFADIEGKAKEMNRTLLESAGAADFGLGHVGVVTGELNERLDELRGATADLNETFFTFGAQAKEQQQVINQLNQAGFTYAKMTKGMESAAQRGKAYADVMSVALTHSRALGVSSGEMAQKMGTFTLETGLGLDEIGKQFSTITTEALRAGFTTKRFYGIITEVTSGMAFYGVRIEETAKLLSNFSSLLGETVGGEAFKGIVGKTKGKGAQERAREILLKGRGFVGQELRGAGERSLASLGAQEDLTKKLGAKGLDIGEMVRNLTEDQLRLALEKAGVNEQQITQAAQAQRMLLAEQRGMGAMAEAMGTAGPGFEVAMAMEAGEVFQGKDLAQVMKESRMGGDAGVAMQAGLEKVAEQTQQSIAQVTEMIEQANTKWTVLAEIQKKVQAAGGDQTVLSDEDRQKLAQYQEEFGTELNAVTGAIEKNGIELKDAKDLIKITGTDSADKLANQFTRDQEIARGISENIYGLNEIMEQTIAKILNDIYGVVAAIARKYLAGHKEMEKVGAIESAKQARETAGEEFSKVRKAIREVDVKLQTATGKEKERLLEERAALTGQQKVAAKKVKAADVVAKVAASTPAGKQSVEAYQKGLQDAGLLTDVRPGGRGLEVTATQITGQDRGTTMGAGYMPWDAVTDVAQEAASGNRVINAWDDIEPEDVLADMRANYENLDPKQREDYAKLHGGEEGIEKAFAAALATMKAQAEDVESVWSSEANEYQQFMGLAAGAFKQSTQLSAVEAEEKARAAAEGGGGGFNPLSAIWGAGESGGALLNQLVENTKKTAEETEHVADATTSTALRGLTPVDDTVILPESGPALSLDPADTLFAGKPGGPVAGAMGGGRGGGSFNFYISGGNPNEVYRQIMRALKATGNA